MRITHLFIFCVLVFSLSACSQYLVPWDSDTPKPLASWEKHQEKLTDEEKIQLIRDRRKELDSIRKGDYFVGRNNPEEALVYYLQVAEKLPDDLILQKKIGHAYYLKKDWRNAYTSYARTPIGELTESEKKELLSALFFDESQNDRIWELSRFVLTPEEEEYLTIVDTCYTGIHNCIVGIEAYSGSHIQINAYKNAILDAAKVSPDYQYRNFIIATKFYESWDYRVASLIGREILTTRPDYASVEKLMWFALYEIGNSVDAKKYLLSHLERTPEDTETIIRLGDIAFLQSDFTTANLYYNNAIFAWANNKTDIERKLAYSYARLSDTDAMLWVLAYLLEESDATPDDAAVAISLALQSWQNLKAYVWADNSIKKYKDSPTIIALYLTSMRMVGKSQDAQKYLDTLPQEIATSPIVLLEKAILLMNTGDESGALTLFEVVRDIDATADFAQEAQNYIDFIIAKQLVHTEVPLVEDENSWWR